MKTWYGQNFEDVKNYCEKTVSILIEKTMVNNIPFINIKENFYKTPNYYRMRVPQCE